MSFSRDTYGGKETRLLDLIHLACSFLSAGQRSTSFQQSARPQNDATTSRRPLSLPQVLHRPYAREDVFCGR